MSQAGYNTAVDLVASGAPAVLCPFAEGGQKEQAMRADRMAAVLGASVLPETGLTGAALLAAVAAQAGRGRRTPLNDRAAPIDLAGAERTARMLNLCHTGTIAAAAGLGLPAEERPDERGQS